MTDVEYGRNVPQDSQRGVLPVSNGILRKMSGQCHAQWEDRAFTVDNGDRGGLPTR